MLCETSQFGVKGREQLVGRLGIGLVGTREQFGEIGDQGRLRWEGTRSENAANTLAAPAG